MRQKGVPENYVRLVYDDVYRNARTHVRSSVGRFTVKVGLHQGSALSSYPFDLIIDVIAEDVKEQPPLINMLADDIVMLR